MPPLTTAALQEIVDNEYPPTMKFDVSTLFPSGPLAERAKIIRSDFSDFFQGKYLLDVGCSKGWVANHFSTAFEKVVAFEPDAKIFQVAYELRRPNVEVYNVGFRDFFYGHQFDKIFAGNVCHHILRECGDFTWVSKLAALSSGKVLIEGPRDGSCRDLRTIFPDTSVYDEFIPAMTKYFTLELLVPTTLYTPDRYFMLFRRRELPKVTANQQSFVKMYRDNDDPSVCRDPVSVLIASMPPRTSQVLAFVPGGWVEEKLPGKPFGNVGPHERKLFIRHLQHNIFLSKIGYFDFDSAPLNYMQHEGEIYFDKSATLPIQKFLPIVGTGYLKLFRQSHNQVPVEYAQEIADALVTKDCALIQKTLEEVLWKMENG